MASIPTFASLQVVPPEGEAENPMMASLCRSLALVNAVAYFLESLKPGRGLPQSEGPDFVQVRIAAFAENVYNISAADAAQARRDVQQLSLTLGIELFNISVATAEGRVN